MCCRKSISHFKCGVVLVSYVQRWQNGAVWLLVLFRVWFTRNCFMYCLWRLGDALLPSLFLRGYIRKSSIYMTGVCAAIDKTEKKRMSIYRARGKLQIYAPSWFCGRVVRFSLFLSAKWDGNVNRISKSVCSLCAAWVWYTVNRKRYQQNCRNTLK